MDSEPDDSKIIYPLIFLYNLPPNFVPVKGRNGHATEHYETLSENSPLAVSISRYDKILLSLSKKIGQLTSFERKFFIYTLQNNIQLEIPTVEDVCGAIIGANVGYYARLCKKIKESSSLWRLLENHEGNLLVTKSIFTLIFGEDDGPKVYNLLKAIGKNKKN